MKKNEIINIKFKFKFKVNLHVYCSTKTVFTLFCVYSRPEM